MLWVNRSNSIIYGMKWIITAIQYLAIFFNKYGVKTNSLKTAPTLENLKNSSIYIIVDPDNEKESPRSELYQ